MYSLILMTAMATSGDTASFGWRNAGCHGCYGSCYGSCYGGWGGCCGGSGGCCGGSCHGAGWYGSACWGSCYGSSYQLSCHGYGMGCGGFYGVPYTGLSCHGSACYGGCHGSCLGSSCYGWSMGGGAVVPNYYGAAPAPAAQTFANVIVELPAGAKLYVDGQLVNGAAATRRFHTPDLPAGQAFYYEMKAETEVDGKPVSQTTKVVVHAGETVTARFDKLTAAAPAGQPGGTSVATK